jgi:AraC-like DNA-binding protein
LDGEDAHAVAVGTTLALIARRQVHPDSQPVLNWIIQADHNKRASNIGNFLEPWRSVGPELMSRVLTAMDARMLPGSRLRYASASPNPCLPAITDTQVQHRAAMVPATLWPSWAMRILDNRASLLLKPDSFRAALSAMLLLPGTKITYDRAVELLGNHADANTTIKSIRATFNEAHLKPLISSLAQLAAALDMHGSPINYSRRRKVFIASQTFMDRDAYKQLCIRQGWPRGLEQRTRLLDRYLLALLTGTLLISSPDAPNLDRDSVTAGLNSLRYGMPAELREFLNEQALAQLVVHRINEPLVWEPPSHWVSDVTWLGVDPDQVDQQMFLRQAAQGATVTQMAKATNLTTEHVRLYADISGITAPERKWTNPARTTHGGVLAPDKLRELYEHRGLSIGAVARLAGCSRQVVHTSLHLAGIRIREAHRQRSLPITRDWLENEYLLKRRTLADIARELGTSRPRVTDYAKGWDIPIRPRFHRDRLQMSASQAAGVRRSRRLTREWLEDEYVNKQRTLADIAAELGTSRSRVAGHAKEWNIPLRPRFYVADPLSSVKPSGRLSPAVEAAFAGRGAVERIHRIAQLPGHRSIKEAAVAMGVVRETISGQLRAVEQSVGFKIIERVSPLRFTRQGESLVQEAQAVLCSLRDAPSREPRSRRASKDNVPA